MFHRLQPLPISLLLFITLTPLAIFYYAIYVFNPANIGFLPLYIFQVAADTISILIATSLWLTLLLDILQPEHHKRKLQNNPEWLKKNQVTVDVFVTVLNEPIEIVTGTLQAAVDMDYPHKTFLLDDGNSAEMKQIADQLNIEYIARPVTGRKHAKAGNINYGLQRTHGEFFAIFDADFSPRKNFLTKLLPFFENKKIALVQTPQSYSNTHNFIASGTAQAQEIFYKFVMPAKNSYNAAFCVGTNMIYRRDSINQIGGIAKLDHSEDIWTTINLHEKGYESVFYHQVLATGRAPETVSAFFRQQNRWSQGGFSLMFTNNPLFSKSLTVDQKIQYFLSNIFFFSGFSILIYLLLPLTFLLFGIHPMKLNSLEWIKHYVPFFLAMYIMPLTLIGKPKLATISVALASFYPYIQGFFSTLFQSKFIWVPTEAKKKIPSLISMQIWPHLFIIFVSLFSLIIGWYNANDITTTVATSIWVSLNTYILFSFLKNSQIKS